MIRKAHEMRLNDEVELKGGKGTIKIVNILEKDEVYGTGRLFAISIIPPGCSIGYHQHVGDFETYYFLKGKAKVVDNGKEDILGPGDSMVCYEGDWHVIENIGDEDLEYVAVILYTEQKKEEK